MGTIWPYKQWVQYGLINYGYTLKSLEVIPGSPCHICSCSETLAVDKPPPTIHFSLLWCLLKNINIAV